MKSITIHKLDEATSQRLEEIAEREGKSLNQCIKQLLRQALGTDEIPETDWTEDFRPFFGSWSAEEAKAFGRDTARLGEIDKDLWP